MGYDTGTIAKKQTLEELAMQVRQKASVLLSAIESFKGPSIPETTKGENSPTPRLPALEQITDHLLRTQTMLDQAQAHFTDLIKGIRE